MSVNRAITISKKGLTFDIVRQSRLLPPIGILNSFFLCGVDDADSDVALQWKPFELNQKEYSEFHKILQESIGGLTIDGLGFDNYHAWFETVAVRNTNT